ncbi:hypothetical protein SOCEGT47_030390 [Sorangium cellulosum]|uniref:Integral membrane protein n=1 Tax=Sorangium cellulosum TaxID=56 RepID=A0A4P2Q0V7_SORCE|nr:hypothetical protein [Sorangium cellulosum]AUX22536.1 hypothetical protein SOCEGT47_030390 [Sorangium cellulosum]
MATTGPEDRERFARREEAGVPTVSSVRPRSERESTPKVLLGGSLAEVACGAATVVLSILALTGTLQGYLVPIATIVFGVALIAHGGAVAARFRALSAAAVGGDTRAELGGGTGAELIGGAAGVVLGILALVGIAPAVLLPVAVIVFGGALLVGSGLTADIGSLEAPGAHERLGDVARQASLAASGLQTLVGAGAVVLGILALVGIDPTALTLVGLLALGSSLVLSGTSASGRLASTMRR